MDQDAIVAYAAATFPGVDVVRSTEGPGAGDTFFIYDPNRNLEGPLRFPFATIVTKDYGDFDRSSNLDRPGVFRLNVGVGRETFQKLFGAPPAPGDADFASSHDFAALDRLIPHPAYAAQSWVSVLNPSLATFEQVKPLLAEAYRIVAERHARREVRASSSSEAG